MWPYWALYLAAAAGALSASANPRHLRRWSAAWIATLIALTLMVGYRFEVGGDWFNYFHYVEEVENVRFTEVLSLSDPGYYVLSWLSVQLGYGIFGLNLSGALIFVIGLTHFCRTLPRPWLGFAVSIPYLVIVVGMGYSRQGIALGMAMMGFAALRNGSLLKFATWVLIGATFHKTAVLLLPLAALVSTSNRTWALIWVSVFTAVAYALFLQDSVEALYTNYVEAGYQSQGALIRLGMNLIPAILVLRFGHRMHFSEQEGKLWRWMAILSLVLFGVLFATSASTAVDRIALYILPLQLIVFSRLPSVLARTPRAVRTWVVLVLVYYGTVQFIWLHFAVHSAYWLPYRFYPLELI